RAGGGGIGTTPRAALRGGMGVLSPEMSKRTTFEARYGAEPGPRRAPSPRGGEGGGEGASDSRYALAPSPGTLRVPTSPRGGEVEQAARPCISQPTRMTMQFGVQFFPSVGPDEKSAKDYFAESLA